MKFTIDIEYASYLSKRLSELEKEIGNASDIFEPLAKEKRIIMREFLKYNNKEKRKLLTTKKWKAVSEKALNYMQYEEIRSDGVGFDINKFLDVFNKIKLKKDIVLDYAFDFTESGAIPLPYTRKKNSPKITPFRYIKLYGYGFDAKPYLKDIIVQNDPESFFQLVIFSNIVHNFYRKWHAYWYDYKFIFNFDNVEEIFLSIQDFKGNSEFEDKYREKLMKISLQSFVEINDNGAECICIMFSKFIGFYHFYSTITYPNLSIKNKKETIIPFDIGYRM